MSSSPIVVHHLEYSRSLRILWLLEELGLQYDIQQYKRDANFRAQDDLKQIHPLGRAPVVEVDGHVLAESGAILDYFTEREGKLVPTDVDDKLQFRFFMHYAEGSAMPPLLVQLILNKLKDGPVPFFVKPIAKAIAEKIEASYSGPAIELHFGFVDDTLGKTPYFAGDEFSAADIQMFYAVEGALSRGAGAWKHIEAWRDRVTARAAYKAAEAKGGTALP